MEEKENYEKAAKLVERIDEKRKNGFLWTWSKKSKRCL